MIQHPNLAMQIGGAGVTAASADTVITPGNLVDELLIVRQNGAVFSGTVSGSIDGGTTYTVIDTFTNVLALSIGIGPVNTTIKIAVTTQPAMSYLMLNRRAVTANLKTVIMVP